MRKIGAEIASGVAIFLAIIIFIFGFLFLKNAAIRGGNIELTISFNDITGLEPSDYVSVAGLRVGQVQEFRIQEEFKVVVDIEIDSDLKLPKDSRAQIKSLGMAGEKVIDIIPGISSEYLQEGDSIMGTHAGDLGDLSGSMDGLISQAEDLLLKFRTAFENVFDIEGQRNLKQSLSNINHLSSTLNNNTEHLENTLTNIDSLTTSLNEIMTARRAQVETSIQNFYEASNRLEGLATKMDKSLTSMQTLLTKIENEEGALGKVISSDEFYNDLRHLTAELDTLVQDLKKRPQKYLNLGFIKVF